MANHHLPIMVETNVEDVVYLRRIDTSRRYAVRGLVRHRPSGLA
jgi:hypothetical protein